MIVDDSLGESVLTPFRVPAFDAFLFGFFASIDRVDRKKPSSFRFVSTVVRNEL